MLAALLIGCASSTAGTPAGSPSPSPTPSAGTVTLGPPQYRALWVDAFHDGIKSPTQVEKLIADAHRGNLNALIVQVRKRGDAYFNQSDEPRATDILGPPGFDPLAYVIQLAHDSTPRIEVHAWLNTFFVGDTSKVFANHRSAWGNLSNTGTKSGLFDPGVPDVLSYTHKVFMDVAKHYDIDGIHMDYVRYPGVEWGYNPNAIALYKSQTGATTTPAPGDEAWKAWRRGRVTAFVRDLHADLKRTKPNVKLSGALIAYGGGPASAADWPLTAAYGDVFQDWYGWLANKYIDFGTVMNYDSAWDSLEQAWFMRWLAFEKGSGFGGRILAGVGAFMNYPEDTLAQIRLALAPSAQGNRLLGIAIYSYGSTSVYGNADYYNSAALAAGLPRQPYYSGTSHRESPAARARAFNSEFMTQLRRADLYWDVRRGWVSTKGVFTRPAAVPALTP
ncbi:MAG TPA: family 10 glycosylhydrolase [Candidatus Dormibacteraeota bacterium]|nr:family 10 glycosylhydrolase [Candidatus Dormibacteraeota bacterium]